jgi:predicted nucleic acid binding AN1-type Zn finger protein
MAKGNRCFICNKKIGLLGFDCQCLLKFCSVHRLPEDHNCTIDRKEIGKKLLEKRNPKIVAEKIIKL